MKRSTCILLIGLAIFMTGCSVGGILSDIGSALILPFTALGAGFSQIMSETSKIVAGAVAMPGAIILGIEQLQYDITYMGAQFTLSSLQAQAKHAAFQIASFMYHYPLARAWANFIANDPLQVASIITNYYADIRSGPTGNPGDLWPQTPTALSQALAWGCQPDDAGNELGIGVPMCVLLASQGNVNIVNTNPGTLSETFVVSAVGDNTKISAMAKASPYSGSMGTGQFDYLYLPLSYTLALCAENNAAWNSVCAILFSPQMFSLYASMDTFLARTDLIPSFNYTLNGAVTPWQPAVPGQFLMGLMALVLKASLGAGYFLPYPSNSPPVISNAFNVLASYILGSEQMGDYISTLPNALTVSNGILSMIQGTDAPPGVTPATPNPNIPQLPQYTKAEAQSIQLIGAMFVAAGAFSFASRGKEAS